MTFRLLKKILTESLVSPVFNASKASYALENENANAIILALLIRQEAVLVSFYNCLG